MDDLVRVRVATSDRRAWERAAACERLSLSAWVRRVCATAAGELPTAAASMQRPVVASPPAASVAVVDAPVVRSLVPPTSTPAPAPAPSRVRLNLLALSTPEHCARAAQHRPGAFCKTCGGSG
jgi:hypothetical protein